VELSTEWSEIGLEFEASAVKDSAAG